MQTYLLEESDTWDDMTTLTVVESAYKDFWSKQVTYNVAVYQVTDGVEVTDALWKLSKSKAAKHESLTRVDTVTVTVNGEEVLLRVAE